MKQYSKLELQIIILLGRFFDKRNFLFLLLVSSTFSFLSHYIIAFSSMYFFYSITYTLLFITSFFLFKKLLPLKISIQTTLSIISPILLLCFIGTFMVTKLSDASKAKGNILIQKIEKYKDVHGNLPSNIEKIATSFELRSYIGTSYHFIKENNQYQLYFIDFEGITTTYYSNSKTWISED